MYPYPSEYSQIADDLQCVLDCFNGCPVAGLCDCERAIWAVTGFTRAMALKEKEEPVWETTKKGGLTHDVKSLKEAFEKVVAASKVKTGKASALPNDIPWAALFALFVRTLQEGIQILFGS